MPLCPGRMEEESFFQKKERDAVGRVEGCNGGEDDQTFIDVQGRIKLIHVRHIL